MNRFCRTATLAVLSAALFLGISAGAATRAKPQTKPVAPEPPVVAKLVDRAALVPRSAVRSAWTQYGPAGVVEVRAVVEGGGCPDIVLDLKRKPMAARAAADAAFLTVCSIEIPRGTRQAALATYRADASDWMERELEYDLVPIPLPVSDPQRIVVFGDTGCRIKGSSLQDCSDPDAWPFARIAAEAAKLKPDLVIHVGDYLYRENACPADFKGCTGTPFGDNWPTWDADFFAPAKPLLAAAPWVIVRGNHEDCQRAGPGFLRLLGPSAFDPAAACSDHLPLYSIPLDRLTLAVSDNADAPETSVAEKAVPAYRKEFAELGEQKAPVWWLLHRPVWGVISGPLNLPVGGNLTMMAALDGKPIPEPVELMLAGHIHSFEIFNYGAEPRVPPQVVAGFGGDMLDATPTNLRGSIFQGSSGVSVKDGLSIGGFGFLLMTRTGESWRLDVYDTKGGIQRVCFFRNGRVDCPQPRRR